MVHVYLPHQARCCGAVRYGGVRQGPAHRVAKLPTRHQGVRVIKAVVADRAPSAEVIHLQPAG